MNTKQQPGDAAQQISQSFRGGDMRLVRRFRFHWLDGKTDEANGGDVAKAFSALGYGGGSISALDYYEEITQPREASAWMPLPPEPKGGAE